MRRTVNRCHPKGVSLTNHSHFNFLFVFAVLIGGYYFINSRIAAHWIRMIKTRVVRYIGDLIHAIRRYGDIVVRPCYVWCRFSRYFHIEQNRFAFPDGQGFQITAIYFWRHYLIKQNAIVLHDLYQISKTNSIQRLRFAKKKKWSSCTTRINTMSKKQKYQVRLNPIEIRTFSRFCNYRLTGRTRFARSGFVDGPNSEFILDAFF